MRDILYTQAVDLEFSRGVSSSEVRTTKEHKKKRSTMATSTSASTPNISGRRGARDRNKGRFLLYFRLFLATLFIIVVSLYIAMSSALLEHQNHHQLAVDKNKI
mmetsp:Transcript_15293/g.22131  ORF Transcript_15293/g.22131 Transcript_15293/m.22131 type:complete len:104 (+) Transcript_15293:222-533(+)